MIFQGFSQTDFNTFNIDGLEQRMEAIQERIQPKFRTIGNHLVDYLTELCGNDMYLHIAKHARRTINPPKDTWLAICNNKRGYKKHPHFQVGLFDDHVFIWLAYIYELPNKQGIADKFLANITKVKSLSNEYVISLDHTQKDSLTMETLTKDELKEALERFRNVKKGEFLIGRHIDKNDPLLKDGVKLLQFIKDTFKELLPLYTLSIK